MSLRARPAGWIIPYPRHTAGHGQLPQPGTVRRACDARPMPPDGDRVVAWVYLLRCLADDSLYTGWTVDLDRRLAAHQAGDGSRYTRTRLPVVLAAALPMPDAATARREEARIKRLTRAEKLALIARGD